MDRVSKYGSVLGLDSIQNLLAELSDPQDELSFIHVAGTNGKGSVIACLSAILKEAGFRVGRYISPAVFSELEGIQVDGQQISQEEFAEFIEQIQRAAARMETDGKASPTVFEMETAAAFLYFRKMRCDLVLLETGLGGSLDATNVITHTAAAVFTTISRDHMGFLGETLEEIAAHKAGIIKPGCAVVSAAQEPEVVKVLKERAEKLGCPIVFARPWEAEVTEQDCRGQTFSYGGMEQIRLALAGQYQILNAATVLEVVSVLRQKLHLEISEQAVRAGLGKVVWPGRFTCLGSHPIFVVDGAHNVDAAARLLKSVESCFPNRKLSYIIGMFKDKEYEKVAELAAPLAQRIYAVNLPDAGRTLDAAALKKVFDEYRISQQESVERKDTVFAVGEVGAAVDAALRDASPEDVILVFGSLSYLAEAVRCIQEKMIE